MERKANGRTGWAIALIGGVLALVAGYGYVASDPEPTQEREAAFIEPRGPVVPVPDTPRPAPMPDVIPLGPR